VDELFQAQLVRVVVIKKLKQPVHITAIEVLRLQISLDLLTGDVLSEVFPTNEDLSFVFNIDEEVIEQMAHLVDKYFLLVELVLNQQIPVLELRCCGHKHADEHIQHTENDEANEERK